MAGPPSHGRHARNKHGGLSLCPQASAHFLPSFKARPGVLAQLARLPPAAANQASPLHPLVARHDLLTIELARSSDGERVDDEEDDDDVAP